MSNFIKLVLFTNVLAGVFVILSQIYIKTNALRALYTEQWPRGTDDFMSFIGQIFLSLITIRFINVTLRPPTPVFPMPVAADYRASGRMYPFT